MNGLASNLCLLGIFYVIGVVTWLVRKWAIKKEETRERRNVLQANATTEDVFGREYNLH